MGRRTAGHLTMTSGPRRMAVGRAVALRGSPGSSPGSLLRVTDTRPRLTAPHAYPMFRPAPQWRNGRRGRLKICCLQGRAGSSPAWGTISEQSEVFRFKSAWDKEWRWF